MAIKVNNENEQIIKEVKLYTGVTLVNISNACATLAELNEAGLNFSKEPIYTSIDPVTNVKKVRIDLIFKNDLFKAKDSFFLVDKNNYSEKKGTYEFINDYGQATWAANLEDVLNKINKKTGKKWFKPDGARIAKIGEVRLISFFRDIANSNEEDKLKYNLTDLFNGNFKEIQQDTIALKNNRIYALTTVKDGKYQGIYTGFFVRKSFSPKTAITKFNEHIQSKKSEGYPLKESYSFEFKEYTGGVIEPDDEPTQEGNINLDNQF